METVRKGQSPQRIFSAALIKVASRCNLNCDYCYVYHHADQSWRGQPHFISDETIGRLAERLASYITLIGHKEFSIIFHGGEPLLFSPRKLAAVASRVRSQVPTFCSLDFSLQTNGVLLTQAAIRELSEADISVSLSLDGPRHQNDLHRLDHKGASTFDATLAALHRLVLAGPAIFRGVIAVIDISLSPRELLEFFNQFPLPRLDLLLPDATHEAPPPKRVNPEAYSRWLDEAFRLWFHEYSHIPIRWFDATMASRFGVPSPTDAMGLGEVSLVVVDTDGSFTDHDALKITYEGCNNLGLSVFTTPIGLLATHPKIENHARRLTFEGLPAECKTCPVAEACGAGSIMHRYHSRRGFDAPTVYCGELFTLFSTATELICSTLREKEAPQIARFAWGESLARATDQWRRETEARADAIAVRLGIDRAASSAAAFILTDSTNNSEGEQFNVDKVEYSTVTGTPFWMGSIRLQSPDPNLVLPFLDTIAILPPTASEVGIAIGELAVVERYFELLDPLLPSAVATLISDILFVQSRVPEEAGIFSFSDDKAPNVLYIAPGTDRLSLSADDLGDSILHEFLHQVLFHMEREGSLLYDREFPRLTSRSSSFGRRRSGAPRPTSGSSPFHPPWRLSSRSTPKRSALRGG